MRGDFGEPLRPADGLRQEFAPLLTAGNPSGNPVVVTAAARIEPGERWT